MEKSQLLNIGILGCGPIAQFAHFEACQKASNVRLYALCDAAEDLLDRMSAIWQPVKSFRNYQSMLEDPRIDALIIAVSDAFHVPLALRAVERGKHVLVEKPLSHSLVESLALQRAATESGVVVQVAHMKRFDPGIEYAHQFIKEKMGGLLALKAWYGDNIQRYTATDNLQPVPYKSAQAIKPGFDEKADLERYYMMAHGSHLLDTASFLGARIASVQAKLLKRYGAYCWFVDAEFENGALGHLDLTIKLRGDWHEGFQIYGQHGSVMGKTYNPWYYKSSEVECYLEDEQLFYRPLGADGFSYRRQLEHFADCILKGVKQKGTTLEEGIETLKAMLAIKESVKKGKRVFLDQLEIQTL